MYIYIYTCTYNPVENNYRDGPVGHNKNIKKLTASDELLIQY